jgi:sigma-B regulation protein RsbU (phosphoserine phosphatase)
MFPKGDYDEGTVDLHAGDVLIAFTDGVPEDLNPSEEEFGEDRLKELQGRVAHLPADKMSLRISEEMKNWIRDAPQYDDLTFIVMKVAL